MVYEARFENDVKTYGTETIGGKGTEVEVFENDVKTYGTETKCCSSNGVPSFENDVKTYGTEIRPICIRYDDRLRMM